MATIHRSTTFKASPEKVFQAISDAKSLPNQLGSLIDCKFVSGPDEMSLHAEYVFEMARYGWVQSVRLRILEFKANQSMSYEMKAGPFSSWMHSMQIKSEEGKGAERTVQLHEWIEYKMPLGIVGALIDDLAWRSDLESILEHRAGEIQKAIKKNTKSVSK